MTIRELLRDIKGSEKLVEDMLDHEVEVHLHSPEGVYLASSFVVDRIGYKFSPWLENVDGTKGSMIVDIRICDKPPLVEKRRC